MNRYMKGVVCGAASLIVGYGFAAKSSTFFSVGATVQGEAYYCTGDALQTCSNSPGSLIPPSVTISADAAKAVDEKIPDNVTQLGAVLGGSAPDKLWVFSDGGSAPVSGLALETSSLKGDKNERLLPVSAYYVPCGAKASADGNITTEPAGTALSSQATSIVNSKSKCDVGGNVYLVLNVQNIKTSDGLLMPDMYKGDVNLEMQSLSS